MPIRRDELNSLKIQKGQIEGNRFPIWDSVKDCDAVCSLMDECEFDKEKKNGKPLKCKLQGAFLRTMMDITLDNLPEINKTEYHFQKIGLTLLPLFKQLITMQMEEQALNNPVVGEEGSTKIHPVYKEIRIITKDIDKCLMSLGIHLNIHKEGVGVDPDRQAELGDSSYYEDMQDEHEEEADIHTKSKKTKKKKI